LKVRPGTKYEVLGIISQKSRFKGVK
jgi:hypothetical protein